MLIHYMIIREDNQTYGQQYVMGKWFAVTLVNKEFETFVFRLNLRIMSPIMTSSQKHLYWI